jgi:hypothetical protein
MHASREPATLGNNPGPRPHRPTHLTRNQSPHRPAEFFARIPSLLIAPQAQHNRAIGLRPGVSPQLSHASRSLAHGPQGSLFYDCTLQACSLGSGCAASARELTMLEGPGASIVTFFSGGAMVSEWWRHTARECHDGQAESGWNSRCSPRTRLR